MIVRYGKDCDMRKINRNLEKMEKMVAGNKDVAMFFGNESLKETSCCRVCGSKNRKRFLSLFNKYDYYECENCGMLYLAQTLPYKEMYEDNGDKTNGDVYVDKSIWHKRVDMIAGPKVDFVLEVCRAENLAPKSWVDIGCGGGEILYYISQCTDIDCMGVEADRREAAFAEEQGIRVMNSFLDVEKRNEELSKEIQTKDIVSMFNVFEHLSEPVKIVDYLWKTMKRDAVLVIEVPRHPSAASFANLVSKDKMIHRHISLPGHVSIFSEKSMDILFNGKFRLIGKWGFGQGFTDIINGAMLISGCPANDLYSKVLECSNQMQKIFDESGLSDAMIYVAVKE